MRIQLVRGPLVEKNASSCLACQFIVQTSIHSVRDARTANLLPLQSLPKLTFRYSFPSSPAATNCDRSSVIYPIRLRNESSRHCSTGQRSLLLLGCRKSPSTHSNTSNTKYIHRGTF